jgi:hypothetical protein
MGSRKKKVARTERKRKKTWMKMKTMKTATGHQVVVGALLADAMRLPRERAHFSVAAVFVG